MQIPIHIHLRILQFALNKRFDIISWKNILKKCCKTTPLYVYSIIIPLLFKVQTLNLMMVPVVIQSVELITIELCYRQD